MTGPPTPRMIQRAMIDRNGKTFNTSCEREFQAFVDLHDLPFKQNESRDFMARDRQEEPRIFTFQLDFVEFADPEVFRTYKATGYLPVGATVKTDYEVDGKDHKDSSDPWKDRAKNAAGVKVIHIPGFLCRKKMWPALFESLRAARASPHMTVYLDEYSR